MRSRLIFTFLSTGLPVLCLTSLEPRTAPWIYLRSPTAGQCFVILAMGLAVGFISGMFGIGGGFLMAPLLIFLGIARGRGGERHRYRRLLDVRRDQLLASARHHLALAFMLLAGASSARPPASGCSRCCAQSASSTSPSVCPTCSCSASSAP
jgi:predicted lipid-binding transport protein (Tim44 family)